jgi:hypothetical protein
VLEQRVEGSLLALGGWVLVQRVAGIPPALEALAIWDWESSGLEWEWEWWKWVP